MQVALCRCARRRIAFLHALHRAARAPEVRTSPVALHKVALHKVALHKVALHKLALHKLALDGST